MESFDLFRFSSEFDGAVVGSVRDGPLNETYLDHVMIRVLVRQARGSKANPAFQLTDLLSSTSSTAPSSPHTHTVSQNQRNPQ